MLKRIVTTPRAAGGIAGTIVGIVAFLLTVLLGKVVLTLLIAAFVSFFISILIALVLGGGIIKFVFWPIGYIVWTQIWKSFSGTDDMFLFAGGALGMALGFAVGWYIWREVSRGNISSKLKT